MYYLKNVTYLFLTLLLFATACSEEEDPAPVGQPPSADAGDNLQATVNSSVPLNGSGSADPDGGTLTYAWELTTRPDGSSASVTSPAQAIATFTPDLPGTYVATLTVTDTDNNRASDATTIEVSEAVGNPPVAVIVDENGRAISEDNQNNTVTVTSPYALDGSGSSDPDQDDLTYAWTIASQPEGSDQATLDGSDQAEATFTPDLLGEYMIRLTVSDPSGNTNTAEVTLTADASPVLISSDITEDRTLENVFEDPALPDYRVTRSIATTAVLTVAPGVLVEFVEDAFLTVASGGGALIANGEEANQITFTTSNAEGGIRWGGIYFESQDSRNLLQYTTVSYGGGANMTAFANFVDAPANVGLGGDATVKITQSEISQSGGYGIYVRYGDLTTFTDNTLHDNALSGLGSTVTVASRLDATTTFANNTRGAVEVFGSTTSENLTLRKLAGDAYYFVSGNVTAEHALTVEAGATLRMSEDVFLTISDDGGSLIAVGTDTERITFTAADVNNPWGGLQIPSTNANNRLEYATVSQAGGTAMTAFANFVDVPANIGLYDGAQLAIVNSTVADGGGYGIYVRYGALLSFENNTLSGNAEYGLGLVADRVDELDRNTTFSGNTKGSVEIFGGTLEDAASRWVALRDGAQYTVTGYVTIQRSLTVQAGAQFKFANDVGFEVNESGSLLAQGTADSLIVFTSAEPGTFLWRGIFLNSSTNNNVLDYVEVSHGGSSKYDFASFVDANVNVGVASTTTVAITNSTIADSGSYGIYSDGTVNADVEAAEAGNTFEGNPDGNTFN